MENRVSLKSISLILIMTLIITSLFVPAMANKDVYAATKTGLSFKKATVNKGETVQLSLSIAKADSKKTIKWSSSKKKVASVNKAGLVTGKKAGKAKITAKVGKKKYKCTITVKNAGKGTIKSPYVMTKAPLVTFYDGSSAVVKQTAAFRNEAAVSKLAGIREWDTDDQDTYNTMIAKYDLVAIEVSATVNSGYVYAWDLFGTKYSNGLTRLLKSPSSNTVYQKGGYNSSYEFGESGKMLYYSYIEKGQSSFITNFVGPNNKLVWLKYSF